jgi:uncharacterized phage protein gp47/JayE
LSIRTQADITLAFIQWLTSRLQFVDTTDGRPLSGLLFDSIAKEIAAANTTLAQVQVDQGVAQPDVADTDGVVGVAFNWNLSPRGAFAATGIETFQKAAQPTTTIQIGNADGSGGIVVGTARQATGTLVSFTTTETVYLTPDTAINPVTGFYEVDAPIVCQALGTLGNVDAGAISVMQSSVAGIDSCTNKISTTGGRPTEDNSTLARRTIAKSRGLQPGIKNGLVTLALEQGAITDAIVAGPNDPEFVRHGVNGAVDLIVLGSQITSSVQTETYSFNQSGIPLANLPATAIASVVATVGLTLTALTPNVDYAFTQDLTGVNALSSDSADQLSWLNGAHPNVGSAVTIAYQYDAAIPAIQALLDADTGHFITAKPLAKRATLVLINVGLTVRQVSGFNPQNVVTNVVSVLSAFINNLGLGAPVQQSDLVLALKGTPGVSSVVLPFSVLALRTDSAQGSSDLTPTKYQYFRVDNSSFNVLVTNS